jgi:hypothetical protein
MIISFTDPFTLLFVFDERIGVFVTTATSAFFIYENQKYSQATLICYLNLISSKCSMRESVQTAGRPHGQPSQIQRSQR